MENSILSRILKPGYKLATVSGVLTTRPGIIREVDARLPAIDIITTKSYQVEPNPGNSEPVIVEHSVGNFGNSVGLRNPGMRKGLEELRQLRESYRMRALLNVSISGSSPEEFALLSQNFAEVADILELNLSCPHAAEGYGMSIGTDPQLVFDYVAAVRTVTDLPIFPKLTPNVDDIGSIAAAAVSAGADGISAINTVGPRLYTEPHSGMPVLQNNRGNRGGASGRWIAVTARSKVAEIRRAIGEDVPIIGIGGVESGEDLRQLSEAGANVVGLGSVFARMHPRNWRAYTDALLQEAAGCVSSKTTLPHSSSEYLSDERVMEYQPFRVVRRESGGHGTVLIELDGTLTYESSQFAFVWLPQVGEKPFSIAETEPLSFFIKDRGPISGALYNVEVGETVYVRGVYGAAAPLTAKRRAFILAGGTGVAVVPQLSKELAAQGTEVKVVYATSHKDDILVPAGIEPHATLDIVPDDGVPARAIGFWQQSLELDAAAVGHDWALYTIGPPDFMRKAVEVAEELGTKADDIYLSAETATHCGVGLCGECECGGRLTCQEGTFFKKRFLDQQGIRIADLPAHEHHHHHAIK
jgi:dihydroorotate dehydrogenase electron transfer subunit